MIKTKIRRLRDQHRGLRKNLGGRESTAKTHVN
jgi:hypothetical protein